MKYISLSLFIALALVIGACSAQAAPEINATTTAPSVAVTDTQVALSTATSIPPSPTETQPVVLATETPTEIPSLEATVAATSTGSASGNPCNKLLQTISGGKPAKIKIENNSGFPITVSLFLNTTPFGDCGYRGYTLGKYGSILITDLIQACYNISVLIDNPKKQTKAFGYGCINNPDKWSFIVSKDSVSLQGR